LIWKGRQARANCGAADRCFDEFKAVAELFTDCRENPDRGGCNFWPDTVAGQHGYTRIHTPNPYPASCEASRPAGTAARPQISVVIASKSSSVTASARQPV
jgi:hypothetical protein